MSFTLDISNLFLQLFPENLFHELVGEGLPLIETSHLENEKYKKENLEKKTRFAVTKSHHKIPFETRNQRLCWKNHQRTNLPIYKVCLKKRIWELNFQILALDSTLQAWRGRFFSGWCIPGRKRQIKLSEATVEALTLTLLKFSLKPQGQCHIFRHWMNHFQWH